MNAPAVSAESVSHGDRLAVLNIQRTCVHDGPGIRTTVFFRGCTLRCRWCQNPEAQPFVSPSSGHPGRSVSEIMSVVARDAAYYRGTHGGLTLSGGEPLAQPRQSLVRLLQEAQEAQIPVAVETAGDVPWGAFEACLPLVDLFLFDLKVAGDDDLHRALTGRPRGRIQDNIERLVAADAKVRFRMCVVPGFTDGAANLEDMATLLKSVGRPTIELMRYYDLHERKARRLGLDQEPLGIGAQRSKEALEAAAETLGSQGIEVHFVSQEAGRRPATFGPRVRAIRHAIRDSGYAVCLETAELKTAFAKQRRGTAPLAVRRASLLRYLLNEKRVIVYPHELLVGNHTSKRVGGNIWVEYYGAAMAGVLWNIDRQKPVPFKCSLSEKVRFFTKVAPYWLPRGIIPLSSPSLAELPMYMRRIVEKAAGFNNNLSGIAHFIVNSERMLRLGTSGIAQEIEEQRSRSRGHAEGFYDGVLIALRGLQEYAGRFAVHLQKLARREPDASRRAELEHMAAVCRRVPRHPARTFHEALQCILFLHIALCTESFENAISLGRVDQVLYPYYQADVAAGRLDYESARELLACFILKFDELIIINDGDSLFEFGKVFESLSTVETVTIGGVDEEGEDCTNDISYMILDICDLKPIGVNMAARVHKNSPDAYLERIAAVYLNGSPMPALFNDEVYIESLLQTYDTTAEAARGYSIVGCVEPVASDDHFGNTDSANVNLALPFLQALTGDERPLWERGGVRVLAQKLNGAVRSRLERLWRRSGGASSPGRGSTVGFDPPASMDDLLARFEERLDELVQGVLAEQQRIESALAEHLTTPLASSLYRGCVESGRDVYEGGTTINSSGIQALGVTDVADSLRAIDEVVFKAKRYSLPDVLEALEADFEGERGEAVRDALLAVPKFGGDDSADGHLWVERVLQLYVAALGRAEHHNRGGKYVAGYYGLNANLVYGSKTPALPSGRKRGVPLANSICPHFGMQRVDLTSALNAVAKVNFSRYAPNGTTLTSTIDSGLFPGESGLDNLAGLIRGYFEQGGMQFQPNLIDRKILLDAYDNPGKYKDLVVRIAGYCGYFDELSDELKREIIDRSYYAS